MTNQELLERYRSTTEELLQLIEKFDAGSFTRKPADNGWNACEVAEHLRLFDVRLNEVLATSHKPAERDPLEKVPEFTPRVTNRAVKLEAPPFLVPAVDNSSPEEMGSQIRSEREKIMSAIENNDLTLISTEFPHRLFGEMTAREWVVFCDMHTHRHLPQLTSLLPV